MEVIKSCLDKFCEASGQIVNGQKTQVFFSKKVNPAKRQEIVDLADFKETREVGRYLEAYILEGRGTNQSYSHIIDKVEKEQRRFIWGDDQNKRKAHLINWNTLCFSKEAGGLGLRKLDVMNMAFLAKLCWGMITESSSLWTKVLWYKYNSGDQTFNPYAKANCSRLWKALQQIWPFIAESTVHRVGDGKHTRFWKEDWLNMNGCLIEHANTNGPNFDEEAWVADLVTQDGKWNMEELRKYLLKEFILRINAIPAPKETDPHDNIAWRHSEDGKFSVKSAYKALANLPTC
ncbi:hypothetical protein AHAS_Ahas19G0118600 [Arachis hypogaea]